MRVESLETGIVHPESVHDLIVVVPRCVLLGIAKRRRIRTLEIDNPSAFLVEKRMLNYVVEVVSLMAKDLFGPPPRSNGQVGLRIIDRTRFLRQHDPFLPVSVPSNRAWRCAGLSTGIRIQKRKKSF